MRSDMPEKTGPLKTEGVWQMRRGVAKAKTRPKRRVGDVERLDYNNPYGYKIERVWFDGKIIFASEQGEVDIDETKVKVAQEYQIVYGVELDAHRRLKGGKEPKR